MVSLKKIGLFRVLYLISYDTFIGFDQKGEALLQISMVIQQPDGGLIKIILVNGECYLKRLVVHLMLLETQLDGKRMLLFIYLFIYYNAWSLSIN